MSQMYEKKTFKKIENILLLIGNRFQTDDYLAIIRRPEIPTRLTETLFLSKLHEVLKNPD